MSINDNLFFLVLLLISQVKVIFARFILAEYVFLFVHLQYCKFDPGMISVDMLLCFDLKAKVVISNCINRLQTVQQCFQAVIKIEAGRTVPYLYEQPETA